MTHNISLNKAPSNDGILDLIRDKRYLKNKIKEKMAKDGYIFRRANKVESEKIV